MLRKIAKNNKYNFSDTDLAFKVRKLMFETLIKYDPNSTGLFEQNQIIQALVSQLNEDENELKYVVNNVFRYDVDGDGAITYNQFTNFCVQQHFGQMAIQRLHRNGLYSQGLNRKMNSQQFKITLQYSLDSIHVKQSPEIYYKLFQQVDLDRDGWITYQEYFMFLREYFGSESQAAISLNSQEFKPQKKKNSPKQQHQVPNAQDRFAKLIYTQFKIMVMEHDFNKNLRLEAHQIQAILQNLLQMPNKDAAMVIQQILGSPEYMSYEYFMKIILPYYFCEYDVNRRDVATVAINEMGFQDNITVAANFLPVTPSDEVLNTIFKHADEDHDGLITKVQYISVIGSILQNYQFDHRGRIN